MKILELFAGIGACSKAFARLGIEHEIVDAVEIDKYAIASFNAIHGTDFCVQDICEWNKDIEVDLIMHGSPCQDFSIAGKQAGGDIGSGTRSSLMYETIRIVGKLRPKYVIWENVKNVLSAKHKHNFDNYLTAMSSLGYTNYYQVLNAKDYGIPQNRERVFTISVLNGGGFEFPQKEPLELRLKDLLEDEVDRKYYLSNTGVEYFQNQALKRNEDLTKCREEKLITVAHGQCKGSIRDLDISPTLDTQFSNNWRGVLLEPQCIQVQTLQCNDNMGVVTYMQGGNRQPMMIQEPMIYDDRDKGFGVKITDICPTQRAMRSGIKCIYPDLRIRKLTPKECWRLMGFDDEDFEKAAQLNSNTQLYKQAGNSIVVNVLEVILRELLDKNGETL